ncbi:MAG: hypothetical protein WDW38_010287 [Sanguina aurantia]
MDPGTIVRAICHHFPTRAIPIFRVVANIIINDGGYCEPAQQQLLAGVLVFFCVLVFAVRFTDTYTASNGGIFHVILIPFYGPLCSQLPSQWDKDQVATHFHTTPADFVAASAATGCFLLVSVFCNPMVMCFFPNTGNPHAPYSTGYPFQGQPNRDGTSTFGRAVVAILPVFACLIAMLFFICLTPKRQMIGRQNLVDTVPVPFFNAEEEPNQNDPEDPQFQFQFSNESQTQRGGSATQQQQQQGNATQQQQGNATQQQQGSATQQQQQQYQQQQQQQYQQQQQQQQQGSGMQLQRQGSATQQGKRGVGFMLPSAGGGTLGNGGGSGAGLERLDERQS